MPRKRGPKGMGSIRQRKDGTWEGRYYVSLPDGRRERRSVYGATEREVTVAVRRALREADQGLAPAKLGITVGQLLEDWLAMKRGAVKARTWEHYADKVRLYLLPYLGKIQLTSLKVTDLKRMYDALGQRLAPRTVHHAHRVLHNALQYAVRMGLTGRNVAAMIDAPRVPEQEMEALRFAEAQRVLEAARGDRYEALWTLA
ncbi:MAG: N-terminal phage integrase SAM-like domain-containing protein, partial [Armatimonadota bacterium]|nr:N-terminal phage integrase SAM-like domain-containing protein [Armatimonadota bacterium]